MNEDTTKFIEELKSDDNVLGVVLFGSWARGNNRTDSDVDLVVILKDGYQRTVETRGEQVFELIYTTAPSAFDYWNSNKDDCAGLWNVAKIVYDTDDVVKNLKNKVFQEIVSVGKKEIDEKQLGQFRFDAEDQIRFSERLVDEDITKANFILMNKVFNLTSLFFDIRQVWTPAPKQRLEEIKELKPELYDLLEQFYSDNSDIKNRLDTASKIIPVIFEG